MSLPNAGSIHAHLEAQGYEFESIRINPDGSVEVVGGTQEAQAAAESCTPSKTECLSVMQTQQLLLLAADDPSDAEVSAEIASRASLAWAELPD